jgi:dihydrolipoamide dehydrogenase
MSRQDEKLEHRQVDVAVIGAGTAGLAAYRAAVAAGKRAVLIESGPGGTTCARVGCMPSKLLIAAAEAAHDAAHAGPFGVHTTVRVDGREVMDRVRRERDRFVGFVTRGVDAIPAADKITGHAAFVRGPSGAELAVAGLRLRATAVVIATGSSPVVPAMFSPLGDRVVVNDDVFGWESLPKSVAVFGAGVIGLELGQALARLGVRVRVFGRSGTLGGLTDPAVKAAALAAFAAELPIDLDAKVEAVARSGDDVVVTFVDADGVTRSESFEYALVAAGRRPNLNELGLDAVDVPLRASGVPVYDPSTLQCGRSGLFLAGDVNDDVPLLHEAADEGKIAGENAARFPDVRPGLRRSRLAIVFTDPGLATVGDRFADLRGRGDAVTGEVSFEDQGRSRVMLKNRGLLHVYAERGSGRLLGAEIAGPRAEHLGHLLAWAHQQRLTIAQMLTMPVYHPVIEEGLRTALRDAAGKLAASS